MVNASGIYFWVFTSRFYFIPMHAWHSISRAQEVAKEHTTPGS